MVCGLLGQGIGDLDSGLTILLVLKGALGVSVTLLVVFFNLSILSVHPIL